jgi:membrane protease YdiL (CAAX protease family)
VTAGSVSHARLFFHVSLGALFVPCVGIPLAVTLALMSRLATSRLPEVDRAAHLRWLRALWALVAVDVALVASLLAFPGPAALGGGVFELEAPVGSRSAIGVHLEPRSSPPRVAGVAESGPAAAAGMEVGDEVLAVDGRPVETVEALQERIRQQAPGAEVTLELSRGGLHREVTVTPALAGSFVRTPRGLFEPSGGETCEPTSASQRGWLFPAVGALVVVGLYLGGRRRGLDATLVYAAGVLVVVSLGAASASLAVCQAVGGPTRGGFLLGLLAQTTLLAVGGLWLWARSRKKPWWQPAEAPPPAPWGPTALLGGWYMLTGALRLGVVLLLVTRLVPGEAAARGPFESSPIHALAGEPLGWLGVVLFILPVVLLAPVAEEAIFRGAVLPWLRAWLPRWLALFVSAALFAVLHLFYGPFVIIILWYGIVLGWARLRSGGMRAPIALHMTINGVATAVLLLRAG